MIKGIEAVRGELSALDKQLSLIFQREDSASHLHLHRSTSIVKESQHLTNCIELLKKVTFLSFDVKEWIIENDLLVHRLKEDDTQRSVGEVVENFSSLLERVQGVPPESSSTCYELAVAYNISHLVLRGHANVAVGGHHKSTSILQKSLSRAFTAFEINDWREEALGDNTDLFSAANIDHTLKQLLPSLFNEFHDHNIGCSPLVLSCCLLAFLWLLDEHVNRTRTLDLLSWIQSHLRRLKKSAGCNAKEEVAPGSCPVYLFSLEYIPSITNCIITSSIANITDTQHLLSVVTSLLAFSHCANKDYDKVLATLEERVDGQDVGFSDLYLKGYVLYVRNEVDKALSLFQQCVHISHGQDKAAALIMLGCCCAVKGKHHTAVAKFKEAMQNDFQQLEALFNVCLQYRKLGNFTAELQCLKLLKQAINNKVESEQFYNVAVFPNNPGHDPISRRLELTVPPRFTLTSGMARTRITRELITYMLAKRSAELGRFEEAADSYLELLSIIMEMSSSNSPATTNLPSSEELYHHCASALLKAARYPDTVTVCDKVLTTAESANTSEQGNSEEQRDNSRAPRKRLRSNEFDSMTSTRTGGETFSCHMLMLKAEALIHLHQPLEALQSLNRILKVLEVIQWPRHCSSGHDNETSEEQQRKRRRLEAGESSLLMEQEPEIVSNELVKLKVRAFEQKASILEGLDQTHDALHQLHLSLECLPDNPGTVYKHTQLLLKLGSGNEAATNWLRFRGIQQHQKVDLGSIKQALSSSLVRLVDSEDVSLEQVQAMDEQILNWCRKTRNEAFLSFC